MPISVCPAALVAAPLERVWSLLTTPAQYGRWADVRIECVEPEGPARPGQIIHASTPALGRRWPVTLVLEDVDEKRYAIQVRTSLLLGVTGHNRITCIPVNASTTRVQFG